MNIILSKPSKTILKIRDTSGIPVYIKRRLPFRLGTVIRWGSIREIPEDTEFEKVYNTISKIRLVSDKPKCRQWLKDHDIPIPAIGSDLFPCIGRTRYHSGGKGFWFCQTPFEVERAKIEGAEYFSHFYPKTKEYRVHIGKMDGEYRIILYSEKLGNKLSVIWNHDISGFTFKHLGRGQRRSEIINLAKDAIKATGLDFGAVDILSDPLYPQFPPMIVCEVNSAPAGSPLMIEKYSEYFKSLLEEDEDL